MLFRSSFIFKLYLSHSKKGIESDIYSLNRNEKLIKEAIFSCFLALDRAADSRFLMSLAFLMSPDGRILIFPKGLPKGSTFESFLWWGCPNCKSLCVAESKWNSERVLKVRAVTGGEGSEAMVLKLVKGLDRKS